MDSFIGRNPPACSFIFVAGNISGVQQDGLEAKPAKTIPERSRFIRNPKPLAKTRRIHISFPARSWFHCLFSKSIYASETRPSAAYCSNEVLLELLRHEDGLQDEPIRAAHQGRRRRSEGEGKWQIIGAPHDGSFSRRSSVGVVAPALKNRNIPVV
ncbi:hypothetical protein [Rhizobium sp. R635]|uniref:hypothetical protein n=2 Tax=unclassified Rhizobium TaxID=2613769 RepID=UPI00167EAC94|nr:hypothetical protein [Rhizobium sp. R635]